jgi:hypothetical protein
MKNITATMCLTIAVLLGSMGYEAHGQEWRDYNNGDTYSGELWDGTRHGQGTYTWAKSGNVYVGEWEDGKKHGRGTMTYGPSSKWASDKYVGEFRESKIHGQGTKTYADGNEFR